MSASSIWRQSQVYGQPLQAEVEHQRQQVSVERKSLSMDGSRVNIRGEGCGELKVGAVFEVETGLKRNPQTHQLDEMAYGVKVTYTVVLGSKDDFKPALGALAVCHNLSTARKRSVVAAGALWIWDVAEDVCPDGQQGVDWFHAVEPLSQAAHAFYPNTEEAVQLKSWLKTYKDHLYMGRIHKIMAVLHQHGRADPLL